MRAGGQKAQQSAQDKYHRGNEPLLWKARERRGLSVYWEEPKRTTALSCSKSFIHLVTKYLVLMYQAKLSVMGIDQETNSVISQAYSLIRGRGSIWRESENTQHICTFIHKHTASKCTHDAKLYYINNHTLTCRTTVNYRLYYIKYKHFYREYTYVNTNIEMNFTIEQKNLHSIQNYLLSLLV